MANDQLPWLTPFSQQDAPDFAWRTRGAETQRKDKQGIAKLLEIFPAHSIQQR
jgi:hypothetical protein